MNVVWALSALVSLTVAATDGPFVDVHAAQTLTASQAVVLDARGASAHAPYIEGAQVVDWLRLRDGWLRTGRLSDNEATLRRYFEQRGVSDDRPVIVYGAMPNGWGEEGRIWWTLRYLGHPRVYILNGGIGAWVDAKGAVASRPAPKANDGKLGQKTQLDLRVDAHSLDRLRRRKQATILDTRTREEFDGATPYWSSRGGHIPGARWLHWKTLLGPDGRLRGPKALRARFQRVGVTQDRPVVTYCTGGVRSAFVMAALLQVGFRPVANYDGSWWDWARQDLPVE